MMKLAVNFIFLLCSSLILAQSLPQGQKLWSESNKLSIEDYQIKISDQNNDPVYSQFAITNALRGFDFMKKNLNKRVQNIFMGNASWLDTTQVKNLEKQLEFQQIQFDLAEIQTRKFRKKILQQRKKILKGFDVVNQINNEIMSEFSQIRVLLIRDTEGGNNEKKLKEWKEKIASQLKQYHEFRYDNKKRIRLD